MANKPRSAAMHPGPGFRIKAQFTRPASVLSEGFAEFETPDISDLLNRLYAVDSQIRCLTQGNERLCGPVCTVRTFPGDNLMVHKVLDIAQPGDVVVIDAHSSTSNAVLGDIVCTKAKHRGIAGFIVDGFIRDLPGVIDAGLPVFARGTTPVGPMHRGPGEINYAVSCGGIVTNPGDIVVADGAGIVVVPHGIAGELLKRLNSHRYANAAYLAAVQRGEFSNQWVDRLLFEEHQCPLHQTVTKKSA